MSVPEVSRGAGPEPAAMPTKGALPGSKRLRPGPRRITGVVTSDKMQKTRAVQVERSERHAKYGKFVRRRTTYMAHDEKEVSRLGDTVLIVEARPLSKTKRWRLIKVLVKSRYPSLAVLGTELGADLESVAAAGGASVERPEPEKRGQSAKETP